MNDKTLVERVIAWLDGGCSSWNVPSSDIRQMATRIEALEAALRDMMQAVCGKTGFAAAVRNDAGKEYPWPALDIAEERAKQALEGSGNG